jgi:hypothetical protein
LSINELICTCAFFQLCLFLFLKESSRLTQQDGADLRSAVDQHTRESYTLCVLQHHALSAPLSHWYSSMIQHCPSIILYHSCCTLLLLFAPLPHPSQPALYPEKTTAKPLPLRLECHHRRTRRSRQDVLRGQPALIEQYHLAADGGQAEVSG